MMMMIERRTWGDSIKVKVKVKVKEVYSC